jgi:cell division protein FtsW
MFPSDQRDIWFVFFLLLALGAAYPGARQLAADLAGLLSRLDLSKLRGLNTLASRFLTTIRVPVVAARFDPFLLLPLATLIALGALGARWADSLAVGDSGPRLPSKLFWESIGLLLFVVVSLVEVERWRSLSVVMMGLSIAGLTAAAVLPGSGARENQTFVLAPNSPNVFAAVSVTIYSAAWLSSRQYRTKTISAGLVPFSLSVALVAGLVLVQSDVGTATVVLLTTSTLYFLAGAPLSHLVGAVVFFGAISVGLMVTSGGGPTGEVDPRVLAAHLEVRAFMDAVREGGLLGSAWFDGVKAGFLPNAHTNGAYAVVANRLGLLGASVILFAFTAIVLWSLRNALRATARFESLLGMGLGSLLGFYALLNAGGAVRALPFSGAPLPFVGYGELTLLSFFAAAGILQSASPRNTAPTARAANSRATVVTLTFLCFALVVFTGTALVALRT